MHKRKKYKSSVLELFLLNINQTSTVIDHAAYFSDMYHLEYHDNNYLTLFCLVHMLNS